MNFYSNLFLPSIQKTVQVSEINYKDFSILQKFLQNNDNETINVFIDHLCEKYIKSEVKLSAFDKLICLTFQRIISLHGDLELNLDINRIHKTSLVDFLNKLIEFQKLIYDNGRLLYYLNIPNQKTEPIKMHFPDKFSYDNQIDFIYSWIGVNQNKVPAFITHEISMRVEIIEDEFRKIQVPLPQEKLEDEKLELSFKNGILLELLKVFLRVNLLEMYEKNHFLLSKANHKLQDLNEVTPGDVNVYFTLVEKEMQAIADANKGKSGGSSLPPGVG